MNRLNARWTTGFAALALALGAAGCGDKLLGITASIVVSPTMLAFGTGAVNVPQSITVTVTNEGSALLTVSTIKVSSDPNNELAVDNLLSNDCNGNPRSGGTGLSPGECGQFTVIWSPTAVHAAAGAVEIDSSDLQTPVVTLPVTGNAASAQIQVCVLDSAGMVNQSACTDLTQSPPVIPIVNFGNGTINTPVTQKVRVTNIGQAPLNFGAAPNPTLDADVGGGSGQIFAASGSIPGSSLAAGASADFTLTATPTTSGTIASNLNFASNDLVEPTLAIPLSIFVAGANLCVMPTAGLAFGPVTVGQSQTLAMTVSNCGNIDLKVDQFTFAGYAPTTTQFKLSTGTLPAIGSMITVGQMIQLGVTYSPTAVQSDKASFDYQLGYGTGNDALTGSIPVTGSGLAPMCGTSGAANPVANIVTSSSASQNGSYTTFTPPGSVVPLDYVRLNGSTSTVSSGTATYTWQLVSQPAGSTTSLSGANTVQAQMQTLVSGDYVVSLTVKDSSACNNTKSVTIHVASAGDVHIELTWNTSCGDIDLHYANTPGGSTGSCSSGSHANNTDCAYYDTSTSWGAKLDHDDLDGYGPENITQATPADGAYQVWVYYYSDDSSGSGNSCGTVVPTVTVYFKGALSGTYVLNNGFQLGQAWNAADITVSSSATQFATAAAATGPINGGSTPCTSN